MSKESKAREFSNQTIDVPFYVYSSRVDGKRMLSWADSPPTSSYVPFVRKDAYDSALQMLEEMAGALDAYDKQFEGARTPRIFLHAWIKSQEVLSKYNQWKEGMRE